MRNKDRKKRAPLERLFHHLAKRPRDAKEAHISVVVWVFTVDAEV